MNNSEFEIIKELFNDENKIKTIIFLLIGTALAFGLMKLFIDSITKRRN